MKKIYSLAFVALLLVLVLWPSPARALSCPPPSLHTSALFFWYFALGKTVFIIGSLVTAILFIAYDTYKNKQFLFLPNILNSTYLSLLSGIQVVGSLFLAHSILAISNSELWKTHLEHNISKVHIFSIILFVAGMWILGKNLESKHSHIKTAFTACGMLFILLPSTFPNLVFAQSSTGGPKYPTCPGQENLASKSFGIALVSYALLVVLTVSVNRKRRGQQAIWRLIPSLLKTTLHALKKSIVARIVLYLGISGTLLILLSIYKFDILDLLYSLLY